MLQFLINLLTFFQIMENSRPGTPDPIVPNLEELMRLAYNCIYACKNVNETDNILAILNCLPERNRGAINDNLKEQHDAIDELELHYQGAKILAKYNVPLSLDEIREITVDAEYEDKCMELFKKLCMAGRLRYTPHNIIEYTHYLLTHTNQLTIHNSADTSIPTIFQETSHESGRVENYVI